ncbi:hypothetical protein GCM10020219_008020 [Nonomuraea dietziae]
MARLLASVFPQMALIGVTGEPPQRSTGQPGAIFRDWAQGAARLALDVLATESDTRQIRYGDQTPDKLGHVAQWRTPGPSTAK